jgi:hypothetical protein
MSRVPKLFFVFSLIAGTSIIMMLIIQLILIQFSDVQEIKEKFIMAVRNTFKAVFIILVIPVFF